MEKYQILSGKNLKLMFKHDYEIISYFKDGVILAKGGHRVLWDLGLDEERYSYIINKPKE